MEKPDSSEIEAIKAFCAEESKRKQENKERAASVKSYRDEKVKLRNELNEILKKIPKKTVSLTKADAKMYSEMCLKNNHLCLPPILRIVRTNKDGMITPEIIQESIETITSEDLEDTNGGNKQEILQNAILTNMRRLIRTYNESLKLMSSLPKTESFYDIEDASPEIALKMYQLWTAEQTISKLLSDGRTVKSDQSDVKSKVESYFIRTGLTAQRIIVEGKPYKLLRKVSIKKPKVGIGKFEMILKEIIETSKDLNLQNLTKQLQIQVSSMPPETKSVLSLTSIKDE